MKKFAKFTIMLLMLVLVTSALSGCVHGKLPENISCYVPDGAPAMAVANIIADGTLETTAVTTTITTGEDVIAKCSSGEADIAILPTNAAVKILKSRDDYSLFTVNVQGLLYIMGTTEISELSQLVGKKVYSIGANNTPQFVFNKILDNNSILHCEFGNLVDATQINIKYESDGSSIIPLFMNSTAEFAVLGEPAATNLINKAKTKGITVYRLFDLQKLWKEATNSDNVGYPQAGMIVKNELLSQGNFAESLYTKLSENSDYLAANASELNTLLQNAGSSLDVSYTAEIIERCNLTCLKAVSVKEDIETYLGAISAMQQYLPLDDSIFYDFGN